jgi:hypothetical protein
MKMHKSLTPERIMDDEKKRNADYSHYRQVLTGRYRGCTASEAMVKFDTEIRDPTSDLYLAILFFAARSPPLDT